MSRSHFLAKQTGRWAPTRPEIAIWPDATIVGDERVDIVRRLKQRQVSPVLRFRTITGAWSELWRPQSGLTGVSNPGILRIVPASHQFTKPTVAIGQSAVGVERPASGRPGVRLCERLHRTRPDITSSSPRPQDSDGYGLGTRPLLVPEGVTFS